MRLCWLLSFAMLGCGGFARTVLKPRTGFSPADAPAAPTYAGARWWLASPDKKDVGDRVPVGETDQQSSASAAVFYVHGTTYLSDGNWNAPLSNKRANTGADDAVLAQATVFNAAAKVYAPRYRQATLYTFMEAVDFHSVDGSMDLAYQDIAAAFAEFQKRIGDAPFMVAGHAQGSYHLLRLLAEEVSAKPLRDRLIAAYLVGIPLPKDVFERTLPDIPLCAEPTSTRCVFSYLTASPDLESQAQFRRRLPVYYPGGKYESTAGKQLSCVNPISGTAHGKRIDKAAHLGVVEFPNQNRPSVEAPEFGGQCIEGLLVAHDLPWKRGQILNGQGDIMLDDYGLYWMNLRRDVSRRVQAFTVAAPAAQPPQ